MARSILDLLMGPPRPFTERMAELNPDTIRDVLAARPRKEFVQEEYFTMVGSRQDDGTIRCSVIDYESQGLAGTVSFDWSKCLERHRTHGDVIGWFHTHPPGAQNLSGQDVKSFRSWTVTLGGPRYAVILCEDAVLAWVLTIGDDTRLHYVQIHATIEEDGTIVLHTEQ
jgi:proteasome lid subunit RPN8/RPN11